MALASARQHPGEIKRKQDRPFVGAHDGGSALFTLACARAPARAGTRGLERAKARALERSRARGLERASALARANSDGFFLSKARAHACASARAHTLRPRKEKKGKKVENIRRGQFSEKYTTATTRERRRSRAGGHARAEVRARAAHLRALSVLAREEPAARARRRGTSAGGLCSGLRTTHL